MQIKDYRDAFAGASNDARLVMMSVSVLMERVASLPKADRDDIFELFLGLMKADDPAERDSIRIAMEEILARPTVGASSMPLPDERPTRGLKKWAEHVGATIRDLRKAAGLTQVELAAKAGLPQGHISRLENAEHSATNYTLAKIAGALGVEIGQIDPCSE